LSTLPEPAGSQTQFATTRNQSEPPPSDAVIAPINPQTKGTAYYLARRLQAVFNDLGLLHHIPSDWLQPSPEGLSFRSLNVREADKLTLAVEDLAHGYRPPRPSVSPDQLPLF
jgi:hypothetical protein